MHYQYFRDFDAFIESVSDANLSMLIQNLKIAEWRIGHFNLSEIHIQLGLEGGGNITEGISRSDGYVIFFPLSYFDLHMANGTPLNKNSFAILEPGCEFCIRCRYEHDWCSIFIPTHKLALACDGNLAEPSFGLEKTTCRVISPNYQLVTQFKVLVAKIIDTSVNYFEFESSLAAKCAEEELLKVSSLLIRKQQAGKLNQVGRPKFSRDEIIRHSMELLEERGNQPVFVKELAAASQVSERTLRTVFNDYFGLGPTDYLQLRQLHQVHRALRAAEPKAASVSNVLLRYGVWEFGRFAGRYRQMFGELPSETLRKG